MANTNDNSRLDREAQEVGGGEGSTGMRSDVNREVQSEQQGESQEQRVHDAYHALGEVRLGQMESGHFYSDPQSEQQAKQRDSGPVADAYRELGEQATKRPLPDENR